VEVIKGDSDQTIDFLKKWAPQGPWVLNAIDPDRKKGLVANTFGPDTEKEARAFVDHWNGIRNLYFLVNVPNGALTTKAKKEHIAWCTALHVDVDPEANTDIEQERHRILNALRVHEPKPSVIIFSGGGYQGFWLMAEPVEVEGPEGIAKIESYNRGLEKKLGGDHCFNVDRIMRLPGTVNVPDAKKISKGRTAALAYVVDADWDAIYSLDAFVPWTAEKTKSTKAPKKSSKTEADDNDWVERVLANGPDHEGVRSYGNDRSKALWAVCCALIRRNHTVDEIVALITDKTNKLTDHVYDQPNPEAYARKQAQKAYDAAGGDFVFDSKGKPVGSQENIRTALGKLGVRLSYNVFARRLMIEGPEGLPRRRLEDREFNSAYLAMAHEFNLKPAVEFSRMVFEDECFANEFHPVRTYLDGLKWDGVKRIDDWLVKYGVADDTDFNKAIGRLVLIAGVRRVRHPGCKFDEITILESDQGFGKSSALAALVPDPEWFTDSLPMGASEKEMIETLEGKWIVESPELKGLRGKEIEHHKAMLSRQYDRARLSYGRFTTEVARQCIFFASTNSNSYLRDTSGNRRFWPVKVGRMDVNGIERDRDQLWAEASQYEASGESIRLDPKFYSTATAEQEKRKIDDPWEVLMEEAIGQYDNARIKCKDVWAVVNVPIHMRTQIHNERLGEAMRALGWERKKARYGTKVVWCYLKLDGGVFVSIRRGERGLEVTASDAGLDLDEDEQPVGNSFEPL
jgi:hypothetical protein